MIRNLLPLSPHEAKVVLGAALREHRLAANVTQRDLVARSGVSEATLKRIEASGSASLEHVLMVAFALGLGTIFTDIPAPAPRSIDDVVAMDRRRRRASSARLRDG